MQPHMRTDLSSWGHFNFEGLGLTGPTAGDAPVVFRLNHLVFILHIRSQTVTWGLGVATRAARCVLAEFRRGLRGGISEGGRGRRGTGELGFGGSLAWGPWDCADAIACMTYQSWTKTHTAGSSDEVRQTSAIPMQPASVSIGHNIRTGETNDS